MTQAERAAVTAVIGPTNTGKTHLAVERLCAHSSGMMGFPLRLLAREIYDRVVAIKGPKEVGLVTGEEKIVPPGARWLLCTAEAMPVGRDVAFVALDEAQLGADPERGHVFTDRLLRARGREETMILGSAALGGIVRKLVPEAEIIGRPRFSTLSYAGAKKLARLPPRSAIVGFSTEEVYAVAEMLRRSRGGAAVVTGALSPQTRNAQVAMFMNGEVDCLVATDAIGMGLNLDIGHIAFAGLHKFDGRRRRRLTIPEMAQIAGRAGRHQRDGTFGSLGAEDGPATFRPDEIEAIEAHRFPRLEALYWRRGDLDFASVDALLASLEQRPDRPGLIAAPQSVDLAVLRLLAEDATIRARADGPVLVERLWAACGVPDFQKVGPDHHARLVTRLFQHLSEGDGHVPVPWFADEVARLDRTEGDIDTLGARIAAIRTWSYFAQRRDWLADPIHWAARTREIESRLSDALHAKLTERFVDRIVGILVRQKADPDVLDVRIDDGGRVLIDDALLGHLDGFAFTVDPTARGTDRKRLLAAAERRLGKERAARAAALVAAPDADFALMADRIIWRGTAVAALAPGKALTRPKLIPDRSLAALTSADRGAVSARLEAWLAASLRRHIGPLLAMHASAGDPQMPPRVRALLAPLAAAGGVIARAEVEGQLAALDAEDRRILRKAGLVIGTLDLFDKRLLKPGALRWIAVLMTLRGGVAEPGHRDFGTRAIRVDLVERIVRQLHDSRDARRAFVPDRALATSMGVDATTFAAILTASGFRPQSEGSWSWRSRPRRAAEAAKPRSPAFAALENWTVG